MIAMALLAVLKRSDMVKGLQGTAKEIPAFEILNSYGRWSNWLHLYWSTISSIVLHYFVTFCFEPWQTCWNWALKLFSFCCCTIGWHTCLSLWAALIRLSPAARCYMYSFTCAIIDCHCHYRCMGYGRLHIKGLNDGDAYIFPKSRLCL